MNASENALDILQRTSRTFYIPISRLPSDLLEAVASAYLCMRAIDEIEDHLELDRWTKAKLLRTISLNLQSAASNHAEVSPTALNPQVESDGSQYKLAEVTLRLGEWLCSRQKASRLEFGMQQQPWRIAWRTGRKLTGRFALNLI